MSPAVQHKPVKVSAGFYEYRGHRIVNHPRVYPRGWAILKDGREIGWERTLRRACLVVDGWAD